MSKQPAVQPGPIAIALARIARALVAHDRAKARRKVA